MNIILLQPKDWIGEGRVELNDHRAEHMRRVLGVSPGDKLRVGVLNGELGVGIVTTVSAAGVAMEVALTTSPPARHNTTLVVALPRPKMLRRVLRTAAEFGVGQVHLIHSYRVEKSYWQSPLLAPERIEAALLAGLERSGDTLMPEVQQHHRFRPFIEDQLPGLSEGRQCLIAHPGCPTALRDQTGPAVLLIGPEGGFIPFELELAEANGARGVSLGSRILSVDTAVNAALALSAG